MKKAKKTSSAVAVIADLDRNLPDACVLTPETTGQKRGEN